MPWFIHEEDQQEHCSSSSAANRLPVLDSFGSVNWIKVKLGLYS